MEMNESTGWERAKNVQVGSQAKDFKDVKSVLKKMKTVVDVTENRFEK